MIISKIKGGLGNQMLQYAAGKSLSIKLNTTLGLDVSWFNHKRAYCYLLPYFNIDNNIVKNYKYDFYYQESQDGEIKDNTLIEGYWVDENYFKDIRDIIIQEFTLKYPIDTSIIKPNSISLHVRRGDKVKNKKYIILTEQYYYDCVNIIKTEYNVNNIYIFSDDIQWAKNNLQLDNTVFMERHDSNTCYNDIILMSLCDYHIIGNSSFSWWGAWLSQDNKFTICPEYWMTEKEQHNYYPDRWMVKKEEA